jgi:galactonate dehydratase
MKITDIDTFVVGADWRNLTIVCLHTDEGLTGLGVVRMVNHTEALLGYLKEVAPRHILGHDPFHIEDLVKKMGRDDFSRAGEVMSSGLAICEMACWDIVGKALDQPVYNLLGGPVRDCIKAYANGWYQVERTPEEFHTAVKKVVEKGYKALKLDPFGPGHYELERDEKLLAGALSKRCATRSGRSLRSSWRCTPASPRRPL